MKVNNQDFRLFHLEILGGLLDPILPDGENLQFLTISRLNEQFKNLGTWIELITFISQQSIRLNTYS